MSGGQHVADARHAGDRRVGPDPEAARLGDPGQSSSARARENSAAWLLLQRGEQAQKNGEALNAKGDTAGFNREFLAADSLYAAAQAARHELGRSVVDARGAGVSALTPRVGNDPTLDSQMDRRWARIRRSRALRSTRTVRTRYEVRGNLRYWSWVVGDRDRRGQAQAALLAAKADLEKSTTLNRNQAGAYATLSHLYNQVPARRPTDVYIAAQRALEADEFLSNANVDSLASVQRRLRSRSVRQGRAVVRRRGQAISQRCARGEVPALPAHDANEEPDVALAWRLADSAVAMVPQGAQPRERLSEDMLVAAVLARASKSQPALADSARHVAKRSEGDARSIRRAIWPTLALLYTPCLATRIRPSSC